jgi:hypothetical protein
VKTQTVVRKLGTTYWALVALMRSGKLRPPRKDVSGDFVWSKSDVQVAKRLLQERQRRRAAMAS